LISGFGQRGEERRGEEGMEGIDEVLGEGVLLSIDGNSEVVRQGTPTPKTTTATTTKLIEDEGGFGLGLGRGEEDEDGEGAATVASLRDKLEKSEKAREKLRSNLQKMRERIIDTSALVNLFNKTEESIQNAQTLM